MPCPDTRLEEARDVVRRALAAADNANAAGEEAVLRMAASGDLLEALNGLEPYFDGIVCFASSMDEHEPNLLAVKARAAIAKAEGRS